MKPHGNRVSSSRRLSPAVLVVLAFLLACSLVCVGSNPWRSSQAWAQTPSPTESPDAMRIMEAFYRTVTDVVGFEQDNMDFRRMDEFFMQPFLPPYRENGLALTTLPAQVIIERPDHWEMRMRWRMGGMDLHYTSPDGYSLAFESDAPLQPAPSAQASPTMSASPATGPPSPGASPPSPEASPVVGNSPSPVPSGPSPADLQLYRYHPLTLVFPFVFKPLPPNATYTVVGEETVSGLRCWQIERKTEDMTMKIWIDRQTYAVARIQYPDPRDGQTVTGNYLSFWPLRGGLYSYRAMEVLKGDRHMVFDVPVSDEPKVKLSRETASPTELPSVNSSKRAPVVLPTQRAEPLPRMLTVPITIVVSLLLVGLAYFGGRYVIFLLSRAVFARDLILVEGEDGPVGKFLKEQGYMVTRCTMELLTEERKRLGKRPGAVLPRAIVVAPDSFGIIKGYLFLLKAYVEEGGRVLVMRQSPSSNADLPFTPYFVPHSPDAGITLSARPNFWKRCSPKIIETRSGHLLPHEFYVEVNQRKVDIDIVQAVNKATGVRAIIVGVLREVRGEYILFQFDVASELSGLQRTGSALARLLLLDLIDYTQGRTREKAEEAETA